MPKKNTARRASTPWLEFVKTRDNRTVRNECYDPKFKQKLRGKPTLQDSKPQQGVDRSEVKMDSRGAVTRTEYGQKSIEEAGTYVLDAMDGNMTPEWWSENAGKVTGQMSILKQNIMTDAPEPEGESLPGHMILVPRQARESDIGTRSPSSGYHFGIASDQVKGIPYKISRTGDVEYRDSSGELHNEHGPALITNSGKRKEWWTNGELVDIHDENDPEALWRAKNPDAAAQRANDKMRRADELIIARQAAKDRLIYEDMTRNIGDDGKEETLVWFKNGTVVGAGPVQKVQGGYGETNAFISSKGYPVYLSNAKNPEKARKNNEKKGITCQRARVPVSITDNPGLVQKHYVLNEKQADDPRFADIDPKPSGRYKKKYEMDVNSFEWIDDTL